MLNRVQAFWSAEASVLRLRQAWGLLVAAQRHTGPTSYSRMTNLAFTLNAHYGRELSTVRQAVS